MILSKIKKYSKFLPKKLTYVSSIYNRYIFIITYVAVSLKLQNSYGYLNMQRELPLHCIKCSAASATETVAAASSARNM